MFKLLYYVILLYATVVGMIFVFNKVHFIIDRYLSKQFCFQVDRPKIFLLGSETQSSINFYFNAYWH